MIGHFTNLSVDSGNHIEVIEDSLKVDARSLSSCIRELGCAGGLSRDEDRALSEILQPPAKRDGLLKHDGVMKSLDDLSGFGPLPIL